MHNFSIENSNNTTLEIDSIHKIPKEIYCNENSKSKSQIHFKKEKEDEKEKAKNVKYFIFTCKSREIRHCLLNPFFIIYFIINGTHNMQLPE